MRHDPGGVVSREVKRSRSRLIYALVLGTLLVLGSNCGVQARALAVGVPLPGGSGGRPEIPPACSAMPSILD